MKILYIVGSAISFVIILILSFENIQSTCNYLNFFFWELPASITPTFVILGTSIFRMITGALMAMAAVSIFGSKDEDEEDIDFAA